jgi:hypothetical protein
LRIFDPRLGWTPNSRARSEAFISFSCSRCLSDSCPVRPDVSIAWCSHSFRHFVELSEKLQWPASWKST